MKGNEALRKSYEKQKESFEIARQKRISNREKQIREIRAKILALSTLAEDLELQNRNEQEFESFESFRKRSEEQRNLQKREEAER